MTDPCGHCGATSHGFICCGLLFADEPGGCPWDHSDAAHPLSEPTRRQHGPTRPQRPPRRTDPRRTR